MKGQTATPQTGDEFEELLNDIPRLTEALQDGTFGGQVQAYVEKFTAKQADLGKQFDEQIQLGLQSYFREQENQGFRPREGVADQLGSRDARARRAVARSRRPDAAFQADKQGLFNPRALGASLDEDDYGRTLGSFVYATHNAEQNARKAGNTDEIVRLQDWKRKLSAALSERIPSEGGFLVPEILRSEILMVALEQAVVRPRARVIPMDSLRVPLPMIDDTSHASSVYGGVIGYWTEEGAALTASAPSFGRIVLEAKKLTAYTTIPNELLQDAVTPLDTWFNMFFPRAIAWFEDVAFIGSGTTGTGVGEPQGFLNAPAAVAVTPTTANSIAFIDIAKMYSRMWPASLGNAVWICSPDALLALMQLAVTPLPTTGITAVGGVAPPGWLTSDQAMGYPGGGNGDGVNYRLMGRPLIVSEKMPSNATGTTNGGLAFVDLDYYLLGDRQTMQIASSDEYLFANDQVAFRVIERLDGRFWLQSAITPENGSTNTLSPLVILNY
jgi:HK97 family phage major capsid protein